MTLHSALPPDGAIDIVLPSSFSITRGYWISSSFTPLTGDLDGSFTVYGSSETTLRISRWGGSQVRRSNTWCIPYNQKVTLASYEVVMSGHWRNMA
jgi:hypothetical protein